MEVLVGQIDDQFFPERFAPEFSIAGKNIPVIIVPNTGHMDLTLTPIAIQAAVTAIGRMNAGANRANEHLCCGGGNPAERLRV
jgi:hypothetical protein